LNQGNNKTEVGKTIGYSSEVSMKETQFTPREQDVVDEMCKGKSNKEIARTLGMAEATVKLHLTEVFRELGVHNRSQAILKALDIHVPMEAPPPPTDQEILEAFTNTAFDSLNDPWSKRVLKFGRALINRSACCQPK
jgi:DNA-binding CsgD family transcriptional regulator